MLSEILSGLTRGLGYLIVCGVVLCFLGFVNIILKFLNITTYLCLSFVLPFFKDFNVFIQIYIHTVYMHACIISKASFFI